MHTVRFNSSTSVIVLDVKLKAKGTTIGKLVLDTGASFLVIRWKLAQAIGLTFDPNRIIKTTTATAVETVPKVVIPEVEVLGKTARNVEAVIKDLPIESHVDGLLGLSFLRHFKLEIDFKKGLLSLE